MRTSDDRAAYRFAPGPVTIEMPTFKIPSGCCCSWSVIRPGPGMACVSRLTRRSGICPHRHETGEDQ